MAGDALGLALTVDTAVGRTNAASRCHLLAQGFASPVNTHCRIVRSNVCLGGKIGKTAFIQIDFLNCFAVLRLYILEQADNALANLAFEQIVWLLMAIEVRDKLLRRALG